LQNEAAIASVAPVIQDTPHLRRVLGRMDLVLLFVVAVFNLNVVPSIAANGGVTVWLWIISLLLFFWPQGIAVMSDIHYPGFVWPNSYKVPDELQRGKRVNHSEQDHLIVSTTANRPDEARVFGANADAVATYVSDRGFSRTYHLVAPPRQTRSIDLMMAISGRGETEALSAFYEADPAPRALHDAVAFYREVSQRGYVRTPDATINRAIEWAKINTVRVQHRFPAGYGFTNDPSQDIVVARDVAWYVLGSDYLTPDFSRRMLELIADHGIAEGGKIAEFIEACSVPPRRADYDLNINDDTPLIACAVYHHYAMTRDRATLDRLWPMVRGACDYIIAQIRGGLVISSSEEANVWGISGWRNIMPQSQITGAVCEINSESAYALGGPPLGEHVVPPGHADAVRAPAALREVRSS